MKLLHPFRLLFISFLVWYIFYLLIPAKYIYDGSAIYATAILFFYLLFFILGFVSRKKPVAKIGGIAQTKKVKQVSQILFLIGLVGVSIKLFTGLFVTKIFLSGNIAATREEMFGQEFNSGFLGVLGALLFPYAVINMLLVIYNYKIFKKEFLIGSIILGIYPFVETFFLGGRTTIALLGTTTILTLFMAIQKNASYSRVKIKMYNISLFSLPRFMTKPKIWISMLVILIGFVFYSVRVISARLSNFNYEDTLEVWEEYHQVEIGTAFKEEVDNMDREDKNFAIGIYSLKHYFVHGFFEYVRLLNHLEKSSGYYYGMYEFHVFFKFFKFFGVPVDSMRELNTISYKPAVYTTFFGPFYIDFGWLGTLVIFFGGRYLKKVYYLATYERSEYVVFYCFLAVVLLASFFINFLMGSSSYYLFGFFVTIFLFKVWPKNLSFKIKAT